MKYSKEQLIKMVKPYFEDKKVELLYVTEDNQVFYPNGKVSAFSHARVYKLKSPYQITRADLVTKEPEFKEDEDEKGALVEIAKELGIENANKRMSVATLEKLIKEKEDARE